MHVYQNEKSAFSERPGGLIPEFFETDHQSRPKRESIKVILEEKKIALLCLENTHNYGGGNCLTRNEINYICSLAQEKGVAVHLDGARINNAAVYLHTPVDELVAMVDTVMFCLSKGIAAPVGSMLCGSHEFIVEAKRTRKFLGGTMRQAGILAAAGIVAIQQERERLIIDHQNARLLAESIAPNRKINANMEGVQTNIVRLDVSPSGLDAKTFQQLLESKGLKVKAVSEKFIRMVTYREIGKEDILQASHIINESCRAI